MCFVLLNSLSAMHNCRWKVEYCRLFQLCVCQINKHTLLVFCSFLKNNLRRINCTVMEVKYRHLSSETHLGCILSNYFRLSASPCFSSSRKFSFGRSRLVLWLMQLCPVLFWHTLPFYSLARSIHSCLICSTSAYLNNTALLIHSRQITANVNSSLPKLSTFAGRKCPPAARIYSYRCNQEAELMDVLVLNAWYRPIWFNLIHHIMQKCSPKLIFEMRKKSHNLSLKAIFRHADNFAFIFSGFEKCAPEISWMEGVSVLKTTVFIYLYIYTYIYLCVYIYIYIYRYIFWVN